MKLCIDILQGIELCNGLVAAVMELCIDIQGIELCNSLIVADLTVIQCNFLMYWYPNVDL
jgi:hypothetical protein